MSLAIIAAGLLLRAGQHIYLTVEPLEVRVTQCFRLDQNRVYVLHSDSDSETDKVCDFMFDALDFVARTTMVVAQNSGLIGVKKSVILDKKKLDFTVNESVNITLTEGFITQANNFADKKPVNPQIPEMYVRTVGVADITHEIISDKSGIEVTFASGTLLKVCDISYRLSEDLHVVVNCPFVIDSLIVISSGDKPEIDEIVKHPLYHCYFLNSSVNVEGGLLDLTPGMKIKIKSVSSMKFPNSFKSWNLEGSRNRPRLSEGGHTCSLGYYPESMKNHGYIHRD